MENKNDLGAAITIISLPEFMTDYEICDEINDAGTSIQWIKKGQQHITNKEFFLLNRVLYVPKMLFSNFAKIDREYAQREFEAYMGFAFNAFRGIGNQVANGTCVDSISLPQQWSKVGQEFKIRTPNYYWGPCGLNPLNNQESVVYSKIYNFLNWSVNPNLQESNHVFCFEKPPGTPVFILSIGKEQLLSSDIQLSDALHDRIKTLAGRISVFFNYFISEILIFIDRDDLYFGCINSEIIRSNKHTYFNNFVCNHLIGEFYQCMN